MEEKLRANSKRRNLQLSCGITIIFFIMQKFSSHFSDALRKEYSSNGIIVQVCVCGHSKNFEHQHLLTY